MNCPYPKRIAWYGTIDRETIRWLRFYDSTGALVLLPEEVAQQRAESEAQRAESQRLRAERLAARAEQACCIQ